VFSLSRQRSNATRRQDHVLARDQTGGLRCRRRSPRNRHDAPRHRGRGEPALDRLGFRYSDNIAYLVSSVSDGLHVLEQVNHLLLPLGMKLKGEGGGVHDLSTGDAVTLLGLDLQWTNGVLDLKPPVKAWTTLRQNLQECYKTPIPSRSALTVLTGWTSAYAPAVTDSDFGLMLSTAAEYGFREFNSETILQAWMKSWERWRRCRARASQRFRSTP